MFTLPPGIYRRFAALWAANMELSVVSLLGFLVLAGVVVNNGIVLWIM